VEAQNFEIRKNVLKYDEVMNRQREVIYSWRRGIMLGEKSETLVREWIADVVSDTVGLTIAQDEQPRDWDMELLGKEIGQYYETRLGAEWVEAQGGVTVADLEDAAVDEALDAYDAREKDLGAETLRQLETQVVLSIIDNKWREHLAEMDYLRSGIGLRAMGQRDPLVEYQREAYDMFSDLVDSVKRDAVRYLFHVQVAQPAPRAPVRSASPPAQMAAAASSGGQVATMPVSVDKVGRNDPCPCGSGKKFKKCHGAVA
jgi:preprotein translocase subunit SecA